MDVSHGALDRGLWRNPGGLTQERCPRLVSHDNQSIESRLEGGTTRWRQRDLSEKRYVYLWGDGVHFGVRLEGTSQCVLVAIGDTAEGKKELVARSYGYRLEHFEKAYTQKYSKATVCLAKNRETLLAV